MNRVILYRCTDCGKWSFAKTRPLKHERFYAGLELEEAAAQGYEVAGGERYSQEADTGAKIYEGCSIWCGPFEAWIAERL